MKTTMKLFACTAVLFLAQGFTNNIFGNKNTLDPRVSIEDNKVSLWFFNEEGHDLKIKVYDNYGLLIKTLALGNELVVGKILDFSQSQQGPYKIVVLSNKETLFKDYVILGSW